MPLFAFFHQHSLFLFTFIIFFPCSPQSTSVFCCGKFSHAVRLTLTSLPQSLYTTGRSWDNSQPGSTDSHVIMTMFLVDLTSDSWIFGQTSIATQLLRQQWCCHERLCSRSLETAVGEVARPQWNQLENQRLQMKSPSEPSLPQKSWIYTNTSTRVVTATDGHCGCGKSLLLVPL